MDAPPRPPLIKRIASALLTAELVVLAILAALCLGGAPFGIATYGVLSGSMEPAIQTGALAFVDTGIPAEELAPGDVAAFDIGEGRVCTHRVVSVDAPARQLVTKGDANADPDAAPVSFEAVFGKTVGSVPALGGILLAFSENRIAWMCGLGAATLLLATVAAGGSPSRRQEG